MHMKKFYTLLTVATVALTATAGLAYESALRTAPSLASLAQNRVQRPSLTTPAAKQLKAIRQAPSGEWTEWASFGTGTLTIDTGLEDFGAIEGTYSGDFQGITVDYRTDKADPTIYQYRFNDIFQNADIVLDHNTATGQLRVAAQPTGWDYYGMGDLLVLDVATAFETIYEDPEATPEEIAELVAQYDEYNYFIAPLGRFYVYLGYTIEGLGDMVALTDVSFQLDGYADFTPDIQAETYYDAKGECKGTVTVDENVEKVRLGIFPGIISQAQINAVLAGEEGVVEFKGGEFDLSEIEKNVAHTIVAITYYDGEAMEWAYKLVTVIDDEEDKWKSLGETDVTLDILESLIFETEPSQLRAELQESTETPGLYRMVDLHKDKHPLLTEKCWTDLHQYLLIDATDPEFVLVKPSDLGIDLGGGSFVVMSDAVYEMANGSTEAEVREQCSNGKITDGSITFPANALDVWCEDWTKFGGEADAIYYANASSKMAIAIPGSGGIFDVAEKGEATAVYYNLQGIKVANPQPGQIVIKQTSSKTAKIIMK